jgi:hypothetical protein
LRSNHLTLNGRRKALAIFQRRAKRLGLRIGSLSMRLTSITVAGPPLVSATSFTRQTSFSKAHLQAKAVS